MRHSMRVGRWLTGLLVGAACLASTAWAGTRHDYTFQAQSYAGSETRQYSVYVPDGFSGARPMVMTLHGCKQTHEDVLADWGMKAAADEYGFILVTPFITTYNGLRNENCWGFWFEEHRHQGGGEVEDLHRIALEVEGQFNIDANRRYITGLSSGGAMTVVAAVAHNEYWAAAASASGLPYGEDAASVSLSGQCPGSATFHSVSRVASDMKLELDNEYAIPMMVLQNEDDCTVVQPAGRNIRDAHLRVFGADDFNSPTEALAETNTCTHYQQDYGCQHQRFTTDGTSGARSIVETVFFNGPLNTANSQDTDHGHYWVGGADGNEGKWAVRQGPVYPDILWDFFSRHGRIAEPAINKPVITLAGDNPMEITLGSTFSDPGASATDVEDGTVTVNAQCDVDTGTAGEYYCTYSATDSDDHTSVATRVVNVVDPNAPTETCVEATDSPQGHINNDRANAGGDYNLRALTTGDNADIGFAWDSWSTVTLTEGEPGEWFARQPEACQGTEPPSGGFTCQDWYDSNMNHDYGGRAYYSGGYYTDGGNDYLGGLSGTYSWVSETSEGYFEAGQCPD